MWKPGSCRRWSRRLRVTWLAAALTGVVLLAAACSSSDETSPTGATSPSSTQDPVAAAEARVTAAETGLTSAQDELTSARQQFCSDAKDYLVVLDRYGKLFTTSEATVGDVKTAGADLTEPRESVSSAASAVSAAQSAVASAEQELAEAQVGVTEARAVASSVPVSASELPSTTTTTIVPPGTITRVQQAEADLAATAEGITDATPLTEATAEYNSAAFALQVAWLRLFADAGCLADEQQADAVAHLTDYTIGVQTQLRQAGYYKGEVDGIYGPQTVDAVKQLQTDSGLRPTGYVDAATQRALDDNLAKLGQQAAELALTQTAALQTVLTLTGYWAGPIDGNWTDELTDALKAFQTALGVEPTGAVDAATMAAFQAALSTLKVAATTPSTTVSPTTTAPVVRPSIETTAVSTATT